MLPKLRTRFGENIGVELFITPPFLDENLSTYLTTDATAGSGSFAVDNGLKFSVGKYAMAGPLGAQKSEIVRVHTVTTPTASLLTLNANTSFAHSRGERIVFIPYNQVVIERSTDGVSYSVLTTIDIRVDATETYYNHTSGASTDYYRVKFSNSASSDVSQYSDGIIATGFADNSVGMVIRAALVTLGEQIDEVITKEFLYTALGEGRTELDQMEEVERWSFRTAFDYDAGTVIPGHDRLTLPTNLRESATNKNLLAVRIGRNKTPLTYADKTSLNRWYEGVARTTLNGALLTGDTSIVLTSSGDFDKSGDISIAGASGSDSIDVVSFTGNTESTNTLTGVTGIQAAGHATGAIVWQGASFGLPTHYTVDNGEIVFSQPFDDEHAAENIWLDYYTKLSEINSDADTLDEPNYKMYIPYLRYRIKSRRNKDLNRDQDADYKTWVEKRNAAVTKEYLGQDIRLTIDLPC